MSADEHGVQRRAAVVGAEALTTSCLESSNNMMAAAAQVRQGEALRSYQTRFESGGITELKQLLVPSNKLPPIVRGHDIFNLVYLAVLNVLNVAYLGGALPGNVLTLTSLLYFLADMVYIGCWPRCVNSPLVILGHHVLAMLLILIPYHYPRYTWCLAYCMLVEINTWLLIAKRTFARAGTTMDTLFLASWVLLRNVWYPYLVFVFGQEWRTESGELGTPWNPVLAAPIFQAFLTGLNIHWTYQLWLKRRQGIVHKQL